MQIIDPNRDWQDTPTILQTPRQQADRMIDILTFAWPFFLFALAFALFISVDDKRGSNRKTDRILLRIGYIGCTLLGLWGIWHNFF